MGFHAASILAATLCVSAAASAQTTWYVDGSGAPPGSGTQVDPYVTIQAAVDAASSIDGDTVLVAPGSYVENVDYLGKRLTVSSAAGPLLTEIVGGPGSHAVTMNAALEQCWLEGFTVRGATLDGVFVPSSSQTLAHVTRCILRDNGRHGMNVRYDAIVHSSTVVRNPEQGVAVTGIGILVDMRDSIVWDNGEDGFYQQFGTQVAYCDLQGGFCVPSCGNIQADPLFWDPGTDDFRLRPGSPCIDAGDPMSLTDPDGSRIEMGALPFDPDYAPGASAYCTAKTNSQGCVPAIAASGSASATAAAPFSIDCADVLNGKSGLFFYGLGPKATPYQGGWLCVRAPVRRTALQNSGGNPPPDDCSGLYSYDFNALVQSGADAALVPGVMVFGQYWFRDPTDPTGFTTGRSDGIRFGIAP